MRCSVSGLGWLADIAAGLQDGGTYRGISTCLRQRISRSPKGCVPRMYWRGSPRPRRSQSSDRRLVGFSEACSRSQRNSAVACSRVRHSLRRMASSGFCANAVRRSDRGRRGICFSGGVVEGVNGSAGLACKRNANTSRHSAATVWRRITFQREGNITRNKPKPHPFL